MLFPFCSFSLLLLHSFSSLSASPHSSYHLLLPSFSSSSSSRGPERDCVCLCRLQLLPHQATVRRRRRRRRFVSPAPSPTAVAPPLDVAPPPTTDTPDASLWFQVTHRCQSTPPSPTSLPLMTSQLIFFFLASWLFLLKGTFTVTCFNISCSYEELDMMDS